AAAVDLQPDGKLLVTSACGWPGTFDVCVYRLNPTGERDQTFDGTSGTANGEAGYPFVAGDDIPVAVAQRPDGGLVVAATCANATEDFCMLGLAGGGTIDDYVTGGATDRDWLSGSTTGFFGTCLRAVSGGATANWPTSDPCPTTDGAFWRSVPTVSTKVAFNTALEPDPADATAHLRFAMRASTSQAPGTYIAPIGLEVLAPNA
ncbi:MAG: uncharacterized protein JWM86_2217, partial [Thermoleophilia bacterium]|nr:uncharacterized protein [Thermoleophilia bacterium]